MPFFFFLPLFSLVAFGMNVGMIQNYETASAIIRQVALTTAAPPPLEVLSSSACKDSSSLSDSGESRPKRGRAYQKEPTDAPATKRTKSRTKSTSEPSPIPKQNTTSFRNAEFKQARYLLAPMSRFRLY